MGCPVVYVWCTCGAQETTLLRCWGLPGIVSGVPPAMEVVMVSAGYVLVCMCVGGLHACVWGAWVTPLATTLPHPQPAGRPTPPPCHPLPHTPLSPFRNHLTSTRDVCVVGALDSKLVCWGGDLKPPTDLRIAF